MLIVESGDKPAGMVDQEGVETAALPQEIYNEDDRAQVQVKDLKIPVVLHYDPRLCEKRVMRVMMIFWEESQHQEGAGVDVSRQAGWQHEAPVCVPGAWENRKMIKVTDNSSNLLVLRNHTKDEPMGEEVEMETDISPGRHGLSVEPSMRRSGYEAAAEDITTGSPRRRQ